jgi:hypothetical protein
VIEQLGISPRSSVIEDLDREILAWDSIPEERSVHPLEIRAVDVDTLVEYPVDSLLRVRKISVVTISSCVLQCSESAY